jgi:hypothetical protein
MRKEAVMTAIAPDHQAVPKAPHTPPLWADVDRALADLYVRKDSWIQVSLSERIDLLATCVAPLRKLRIAGLQ